MGVGQGRIGRNGVDQGRVGQDGGGGGGEWVWLGRVRMMRVGVVLSGHLHELAYAVLGLSQEIFHEQRYSVFGIRKFFISEELRSSVFGFFLRTKIFVFKKIPNTKDRRSSFMKNFRIPKTKDLR